jgi:hypothetical protein
MKKNLLFALSLVALLSTGCPVGIDHPLDVTNSNNIDKGLIGTWVNDSEGAEVLRVSISEASATQYGVTVLERGEMYALETDKLSGWVTTVGKGDFVFFKPEGDEKYYHYQYKINGDKMVTNDVSLLDGGIDAVNSTAAFRKQVATSMSNEEWGQETQNWHRD